MATDFEDTITALQTELADQAARAGAAVAAAQDHALELSHAYEARIAALERRVWWLDHWDFDPDAFMRTRRGRALWAAVRVVRAMRR